MKIFILDDDINIIRILKKIIDDKNLGLVVGYTENGVEGVKKIREINPDLVLVDLLMPGKDGISIVKELKQSYPHMEFIMISQVLSKNMVGKAYKSGVEYYIYKPINALEVESIVKKVSERIQKDRTLYKIQSLFDKKKLSSNKNDVDKFCEKCIKKVLQRLGILGKKGTKNIIDISKYIINNNIDISEVSVREMCKKFSRNPKSMEQRMRRTIAIAMSNIANLGIEDYMNEIFVEYSTTLFYFEQVRKEMDFIRGKINRGGSVNIKKFIVGLILYCENKNN